MNERIRALRKMLDMTQQEFGNRIGLKRNSVALIENGRNPSEQTIKSICREFNVNSDWLVDGIGDMFNAPPQDSIDLVAQKYNLSPSAATLIKSFVNLNESQQQAVIDFVMAVAYDLTDNGYVKKNLTDIDIDASIEEYRRSLELQKKVRDGSSA